MLTESQRKQIREIAGQFGVLEVRLFGSRARSQGGERSDYDLLVKMAPSATLLTVIGFKQACEDALGARVDVVEESGLSPRLARAILREAVGI